MSSSLSPNRRRWFRRMLTAVLALLVCLGGVFCWRPLWVVNEATRALLRLAGFRSENVQLGPYRIHYLVGGPPPVGRLRSRASATGSGPRGGEGRPLVLVHGLGGKAE